MSTAAAHVAHHFDDAEQQFTAAGLGMWLFLATEVLFFGGVFAGYSLYRFWYPDAFEAGSHRLDLVLGTINTAVLLTSSLTMALAVRAAQTNDSRQCANLLAATMALGTIFLGIKLYEYRHKFEEHLVPGPYFSLAKTGGAHAAEPWGRGSEAIDATLVDPRHVQLFFSFYFAMTGIHALHMVIGIAILSVLFVAARRGRFGAASFTQVEMTGLYWHLVDIVWVFLFPLLYLIR